MKDLQTTYWLENIMLNLDLEVRTKGNPNLISGNYCIVTVHDASPKFKIRLTKILRALHHLQIPFNIAIVPCLNEKKRNDIRADNGFIDLVMKYNPETALHGLYHEHNGNLEEFHNLDIKKAKKEIHKALEMFREAGFAGNHVFIPPTWAITKDTVDSLRTLDFEILETEEEIILLKNNVRLLSSVLNWYVGSVRKDNECRKLIKTLFEKKLLSKSKLIRIAIHPKDPKGILSEQVKMIRKLKRAKYRFINYSEIPQIVS